MRFPILVKRGSVVVKVYQVRHRSTASGFAYCVSYNVGPRRFLPEFAELDAALAEARQRADLIVIDHACVAARKETVPGGHYRSLLCAPRAQLPVLQRRPPA